MTNKTSVPTPLSGNGELLKVGRLLEALVKLIDKAELTPDWNKYVAKSLMDKYAKEPELVERG